MCHSGVGAILGHITIVVLSPIGEIVIHGIATAGSAGSERAGTAKIQLQLTTSVSNMPTVVSKNLEGELHR